MNQETEALEMEGIEGGLFQVRNRGTRRRKWFENLVVECVGMRGEVVEGNEEEISERV